MARETVAEASSTASIFLTAEALAQSSQAAVCVPTTPARRRCVLAEQDQVHGLFGVELLDRGGEARLVA